MATAFFKMSHSRRSRSFSRLRRRIPASSGFKCSLPGKSLLTVTGKILSAMYNIWKKWLAIEYVIKKQKQNLF
jgi:hypothetical protein